MMEPRWHISLETSYQHQTFEHNIKRLTILAFMMLVTLETIVCYRGNSCQGNDQYIQELLQFLLECRHANVLLFWARVLQRRSSWNSW